MAGFYPSGGCGTLLPATIVSQTPDNSLSVHAVYPLNDVFQKQKNGPQAVKEKHEPFSEFIKPGAGSLFQGFIQLPDIHFTMLK